MKLKITFAIILSILLMSAKSFGEDTSSSDEFVYNHPAPEIDPGSNILLIGDSLGQGMSVRFEELARQSGYKPYSKTIVGSSTHQWLKIVKKELEKTKPQLVIISLGTNDSAMSDVWIKEHYQDYAELVRLIVETGSQVVWILPPKLTPKLKSQFLVRELIIKTVSLQFDSFNISIPKAKDQIHSTPKGYSSWMDEVWWWMEENNLIYQGC